MLVDAMMKRVTYSMSINMVGVVDDELARDSSCRRHQQHPSLQPAELPRGRGPGQHRYPGGRDPAETIQREFPGRVRQNVCAGRSAITRVLLKLYEALQPGTVV